MAKKIWDLEASQEADGGLPIETDLRGEIHPVGLMRYKGWWYCSHKEQPLRRMRLIRSRDGENWESVRLFTWKDATVFEGKFSETAEGALMINTYVRHRDHIDGPKRFGPGYWTASVTWLSDDGVNWSQAYACPTGFSERNFVRWSVTWFRGAGYSIARPKGDLYKTLDGKSWAIYQSDIYKSWTPPAPDEGRPTFDPLDNRQKLGTAPREPHEADLAFDPEDGTACAVARVHPIFALIGKASAPDYKDWTWREARLDWEGDGRLIPAHEKLGVQIGGPVVKYLSNGVLLVAARFDASTPGNSKGLLGLFILDRDQGILKRWMHFEDFGRQYPGVAEHEGELWVTTGRPTKEAPFEVYLLKLPLPENPWK